LVPLPEEEKVDLVRTGKASNPLIGNSLIALLRRVGPVRHQVS
jgi:hypothetical protein